MNNWNTLSRLLKEAQLDFGFKNTDEKYKKLTQKYASKYPKVKIASNPTTIQDFIQWLDPSSPLASFAMSSTEIEMFKANTLYPAALEAGLDPEDPNIKKAMELKLKKTKTTRWSGD